MPISVAIFDYILSGHTIFPTLRTFYSQETREAHTQLDWQCGNGCCCVGLPDVKTMAPTSIWEAQRWQLHHADRHYHQCSVCRFCPNHPGTVRVHQTLSVSWRHARNCEPTGKILEASTATEESDVYCTFVIRVTTYGLGPMLIFKTLVWKKSKHGCWPCSSLYSLMKRSLQFDHTSDAYIVTYALR